MNPGTFNLLNQLFNISGVARMLYETSKDDPKSTGMVQNSEQVLVTGWDTEPPLTDSLIALGQRVYSQVDFVACGTASDLSILAHSFITFE